MSARTFHRGIVRWYNTQLGYGFIAVAPSLKQQHGIPVDADLFVHANALVMKFPKVLQPEDRVQFEVERGTRGPCAVNVQIVNQAAATPQREEALA